jgi:hypothetical protein
MNEDASPRSAAMTWDVPDAAGRHALLGSFSPQVINLPECIQPTLRELDLLHNFTIESQVR